MRLDLTAEMVQVRRLPGLRKVKVEENAQHDGDTVTIYTIFDLYYYLLYDYAADDTIG